MSGFGNFEREPVVNITSASDACVQGWDEIGAHLTAKLPAGRPYRIAFECYPGVFVPQLITSLQKLFPQAEFVDVQHAYRGTGDLREHFREALTEDPVFGIMQHRELDEFLDPDQLSSLRAAAEAHQGLLFVVGTGAHAVLQQPDLLFHASVTRWELQARQRARAITNLGFGNVEDPPSLLYKNAFFLEWRVADDIRHALYPRVDFFLDLDDHHDPRMVSGDTLRDAVRQTIRRPFRVVPFFDPGPWGGQWMKEVFNLPDGPPNYAWCFDCVPEENSVNFGFGERRFRLPAIILVHEEPHALLGDEIVRQFGAEFPIRFDLLDTVEGGNLSLQVHPLRQYIKEQFGMAYTQDESYYILDARPGSELYLGLRDGIDPDAMAADLQAAQAGEQSFPAERYVNLWPTKKHDHFSIPAGTVHCSGAGNLVLEISATPYIFTFKLWDWERVGLDGRPRPIHLRHGLRNIQWDRNTDWVKRELLDQVKTISERPGCREEQTGLHALESLETRRTWFTEPVLHNTQGTLHVLNLVEGPAAIVESPTGAFEPFEVHYAETFIIPAAVGQYSIRPVGEVTSPLATLKAYVRPQTS